MFTEHMLKEISPSNNLVMLDKIAVKGQTASLQFTQF